MLEQRYRINSPQVLHEQFDNEVVLVNLENGNYYSLNASGSAILLLIAKGLSPGSFEERCVDVDPTLRDQVRDLLTELLGEGLITPCDDTTFIKDEDETETTAFDFSTPPALQRFTDMQDLLLLDPIHDVDERGWPNTANDA